MTPAPGGELGERVQCPRILVVDDAPEIRQMLESVLVREAFEVETVGDGQGALDRIATWHPHVVVLDVMLPDLSGNQVCQRMRDFSEAFVIMLTAQDEEADKLVGLTSGADDYLTKPFSSRELVARVHALLRRNRSKSFSVVIPGDEEELEHVTRNHGDLHLDLSSREAKLSGESVDLTRIEFDLLATLMRRPRMVFTRRQLVEQVWGNDWYGDEHVVDVHLSNARRKLSVHVDDQSLFIVTVRGVGYRMGSAKLAEASQKK